MRDTEFNVFPLTKPHVLKTVCGERERERERGRERERERERKREHVI